MIPIVILQTVSSGVDTPSRVIYSTFFVMQKTAVYRSVYGILAIANVAIFISLWVQSGYSSPDNARLLDWGANYAPLTLTGESWRLLTNTFLHANWLHLLANMYMLVLLGDVLERRVGPWRFASIYLLAALGGSLLSAFWNSVHKVAHVFMDSVAYGIDPVVSVGASGALMGLAGAALVLALQPLDEGQRNISFSSIAQVIVINLAFGFTSHGVDNAAHVGGLVTGLVAALALRSGRPPQTRLQRIGLPVLVTVVGSALLIGLARSGNNEELAEIKSDVQTERESAAKDRDAAQREQQDRKAAAKEQADIDRMAQEDARTQPAPITGPEAEGKTIELGPFPSDFVIGASGRNAYVTDLGDNSLRVVDLTKPAVAKVIRGGPLDHSTGDCIANEHYSYCRGQGANGVTVSQDEQTAYVASMARNSVTRVDLDKGKVIDTVKVGGYPRKLLLSPAGDTLYVFNDWDDTITVVSVPQWPKVLATLKFHGDDADTLADYKRSDHLRKLDMWLSADGKRLFALSEMKTSVSEFDTGDFHWVADHPVTDAFGLYEALPTPSMNGVWLRTADGMIWSDPKTLVGKKVYKICNLDLSLHSVSHDGTLLAISNGSDPLRIVKVATRRSVRAYPTQFGVDQLAFSNDDKTLYALTNGAPVPNGLLTIYHVDRFIEARAKSATEDFLCPALMPEKKDPSDDSAASDTQ